MAESEEEVDVLVQRVMKDINNAFKRNPNIDEIGLIPCPEARYNRSPIVLVENKLGVESWCVKFLLPYVHNKLLLYRQRKQWLDREALIDVTCTLLLLNPDFTTAWNVRKELLECGVLSPEKDLYLGKLALTKFPKSPETWIHRRWVLQRLQRELCPGLGERKEQADGGGGDGGGGEATRRGERLRRLLQEEMRVCADAAGRYPSNYNAWSHRIWVLQHLAKGNLKILHDELSSMRLWVSMHVSDHSGFHYRQFLLKALVRELSQQQAQSPASSPPHPPSSSPPPPPPPPQGSPTNSPSQANGEASTATVRGPEALVGATAAVSQLFHDEMELCTDLIESYPGHETLWCHRRHVFYLWHQWAQENDLGQANGDSPGLLNHAQEPPASPAHATPPPPPPPPPTHHPEDAAAAMATANGQQQPVDMEVDGEVEPEICSLSDAAGQDGCGGGGGGSGSGGCYTRDTKRLKRGPTPPCPAPSLPAEDAFISRVLAACRSPEQRRFAAAYRKWLDSVIGQ
ncbi:protein prenyltransferase alpha subunit repeat-containing protein 1 [Sardina pilchardus]|uniref:protein prenyltransferase alpha subunit repeat-containing protein 1 n=1 Tax=Sardina pilchardus TaxID=27697 RepID=UPI002E0EF82C